MTTKPQRTDQPSQVSTEEAPRAPDEHVVTSDVIADAPPRADQPPAAAPAAAGKDESPASPNSSESAPDTNDNPTPPSRRNRPFERRFNKLAAKLAEKERREAEHLARITALEEQVTSLKTATPKAPEPQLQDFKSPREYAKAYAQWEAAGATPEPPARRQPAKPATSAPEAPASAPVPDKEIADFQARGKAKLGDEFVEAMQEDGTAVNQLMGEFLIDSEVGPEIYVHLANNPEESRKIYDSSPLRATKRLEELAAKAAKGELDVGNEGQVEVEPPAGDTQGEPSKPAGKQTRAPQPPSDHKPGASSVPANPETESMDEYAARRRKEEARKAGANI